MWLTRVQLVGLWLAGVWVWLAGWECGCRELQSSCAGAAVQGTLAGGLSVLASHPHSWHLDNEPAIWCPPDDVTLCYCHVLHWAGLEGVVCRHSPLPACPTHRPHWTPGGYIVLH